MKKPVANHEAVETAVLRISVTAMTLSDGISAASFLDIGARRGVVVVLMMGVPFVFTVGRGGRKLWKSTAAVGPSATKH
jgi:hypothetical protein